MMNKTYAHPDSVNGLSTDAVHRILIQIPEGERGHGVVMAWVFESQLKGFWVWTPMSASSAVGIWLKGADRSLHLAFFFMRLEITVGGW